MDPKNRKRTSSSGEVIALPRASPARRERTGGAVELALSDEGMAALSRLLEPAFYGRHRRTA